MKLALILRKAIYKTLSLVSNQDVGTFILCYHSINQDDWRYSISLEEFTKQIEYLTGKYKASTLDEVKKIAEGKSSSPNDAAFIINFDDGYKDILSVRGFLKEKNIKPVLFLIAKPEGADKNQLTNTKELLSVADIKLLIEDGWEIGSHGMSHKDFWKLNDAELKTEIYDSKRILETFYGIKVRYFSYPRGRYTPEIVRTVKEAGYEMAVTMDDSRIAENSDLYTIPRIGVDKTHDFAEFKTLMSSSAVEFRKFVKNFAGGVIRKYL